MKELKDKYDPVEPSFYQKIEEYRTNKKYLGIHYFTEIHEYISTTAIIKDIFWREETQYILLTTGEEVRLDWIVRLDGKPAPGYTTNDFTCDC
jgi:Rho-binding antiterminator